MTDFPLEELQARQERARRSMVERRLDCLLITGVEDFCYFVGVPAALHQTRRPWALLLPLDRPAIVFSLAGIVDTVVGQGFVPEVRTYDLPASNLASVVADTIKELGVRTMGVELGLETRIGMPLMDFDEIRRSAGTTSFEDASGLLWDLRKVKSDLETERMRRACAITSETRQRLFTEVRVGMSETEIAAHWADLMHSAGADRPSFIYVNTGGDADFIPKPHRRLKVGDTLWVDGGVYVRDYTCDFNRIATMGPASKVQRATHAGLVEVMQAMLAGVKVGAPLSVLADIGARELAQRGLFDRRDERSFVGGHGMGRIINEPPLVAAWDKTIMVEGLVAGLEFGPALPEGLFVLEDVIRVTPDGFDLLSDEPWDLVEIAV